MPDQMLEIHSKEYNPQNFLWGLYFNHEHRLPPFLLYYHVPQMMRDPRIRIGMQMIKGAILSRARFYIDDGNSPDAPGEFKQYVIQQIERWWRTSVVVQMTAIEWGYSGHEAVYCWRDGVYHFDHLKMFQQPDVRPVTKDNMIVGLHYDVNHGSHGDVTKFDNDKYKDTNPRFLAIGKAMWHVQRREVDPWFGQSRLYPSYEPWVEMYHYGGARDTRRKYFYTRAYRGDTIYHPNESIPDPITGEMRSGKDIARQAIESEAAGGVMTFPSERDDNGELKWFIEERKQTSMAGDILEYCQFLKKEMSEGLGISTELIEAAETGSGFSGRRIPEDAFHSTLLDPTTWLISDFHEQIIRTLAFQNWQLEETGIEIIPFGIIDDTDENDDQENSNIAASPENRERLPNNAANRSRSTTAI